MLEIDKQKSYYDRYFSSQKPRREDDLTFKDYFLDNVIDRSRVGTSDRVLELGCGSGIFTRRLLARGASVTGLDISPHGLAIMRTEFSHLIDNGKLQLVEGDINEYLATSPNTYDVICGSGIIHHLSDPDRTFGLMKRCLAPSGRIFFSPEPNGTGLYGTVWRYLAPTLYKIMKGDFAWEVEKGTLNVTVPQITRMLRKHGFNDIDIRPFQVIPHFNRTSLRRLDITLIEFAYLRSLAVYLAIFARVEAK